MPTKKSTRSCAGAPFLILVNSLSYRQPSLWRKKHNQFRPRKGPGLLPSAHLPTKNQRSNLMLFNTKLPRIFPGLSRAHQNPGIWLGAEKKSPCALARSRQRKAGAAPPTHSHTQAHIVLSGREKTSQSRRPRLLPVRCPPCVFAHFFASISWFIAPFRRWWSGWSHVEVPPQLHSATAKHTGPHSRAPQPPKRLTAARSLQAWPLGMQ